MPNGPKRAVLPLKQILNFLSICFMKAKDPQIAGLIPIHK